MAASLTYTSLVTIPGGTDNNGYIKIIAFLNDGTSGIVDTIGGYNPSANEAASYYGAGGYYSSGLYINGLTIEGKTNSANTSMTGNSRGQFIFYITQPD